MLADPETELHRSSYAAVRSNSHYRFALQKGSSFFGLYGYLVGLTAVEIVEFLQMRVLRIK